MSLAADDAIRKMDTTTLCVELKECEADYDRLGTYLYVSLDDIRKQEKTAAPGSIARCMTEMLKKYLRDKKPDLDTLCEALKQVSMASLSNHLREKYKGTVDPLISELLLSEHPDCLNIILLRFIRF